MLKTPVLGLSYPESSDPTTTWEYWQQLAEDVESALTPSSLTAYSSDTITTLNVKQNAALSATIATFPQADFTRASTGLWTVNRAGMYWVGFTTVWPTTATNRNVDLNRNGSPIYTANAPLRLMSAFGMAPFAAGDTVSVAVLSAAAGEVVGTRLTVVRCGPGALPGASLTFAELPDEA